MVDSIYLSAVRGQLQFFRSTQLSSLHSTSSDAAYDGFIKLQFEKFTQAVTEAVLKFLLLLYLSSFCLCLQTSLIFAVFTRSASVGAC